MKRAAELGSLIDDMTVDAYNDEEQLAGFHVGAEAALRPGERATLVGVEVEVLGVDCGPDTRTGLVAQVRREEATHEASLADLRSTAGSELGLLVAAYRRWQGR